MTRKALPLCSTYDDVCQPSKRHGQDNGLASHGSPKHKQQLMECWLKQVRLSTSETDTKLAEGRCPCLDHRSHAQCVKPLSEAGLLVLPGQPSSQRPSSARDPTVSCWCQQRVFPAFCHSPCLEVVFFTLRGTSQKTGVWSRHEVTKKTDPRYLPKQRDLCCLSTNTSENMRSNSKPSCISFPHDHLTGCKRPSGSTVAQRLNQLASMQVNNTSTNWQSVT